MALSRRIEKAVAESLRNTSPDAILKGLIAKLESGGEVTSREKQLVAQFLKQLRDGGGIRKVAEKPQPHVDRSSEQLMAVDYAAQKARHGRGGEARRVVADAWSELLGTKVKRSAVMQAYVAHREFAEKYAADYVADRCDESARNMGRRAADSSREALFDALSNDIRNRQRPADATGLR